MEDQLTESVARLALQLGVILIAAKLGAEICDRYLRIPAVLGELAVGIIIGPYALGALGIPGLGPLFPNPHVGEVASAAVPVSTELYSLANIGAVILLFAVGLETDIQQFFRYAGPGILVAIGGVILPFFFGAWATVLFGFANHLGDPKALFMGAILTATSIGITARVLSDMGRLGTPEGVTVIAGAVVDDVLGILVLTIVVGITAAGSVTAGGIVMVGVKAIGFWIGLTGGGLILAGLIARFVGVLRTAGAGLAVVLGLAFVAAAVAEQRGLAMIIGAYSMGLALSRTALSRRLEESLRAVYHVFVPVFFVVIGMLVDVPDMLGVWGFGAVIAAVAIVSKLVGSGVPALFAGFNFRGASRIGVGMLPRGEVALIIAGIGLTRGVVDSELFGVSVLMTAVTTILGPLLLIYLFSKGGSGRRLRLTEEADGKQV